MSRDRPPVKPSLYRLDTSLTGYSPKVSRPASPHTLSHHYDDTLSSHHDVTSSSHHVPQIPLWVSRRSSALRQGGSEHSRTSAISQTATQYPSWDADHYRSDKEQKGQLGGHVSRRPLRRSAAGFEPFSLMPTNPQPSDFDEVKKGRAHNRPLSALTGGTGGSTGLQRTPGSRNPLNAHDMGSRKCLTYGVACIGTDIAVGIDLDLVSDGSKGEHWVGGASRTFQHSDTGGGSALTVGGEELPGYHRGSESSVFDPIELYCGCGPVTPRADTQPSSNPSQDYGVDLSCESPSRHTGFIERMTVNPQ